MEQELQAADAPPTGRGYSREYNLNLFLNSYPQFIGNSAKDWLSSYASGHFDSVRLQQVASEYLDAGASTIDAILNRKTAVAAHDGRDRANGKIKNLSRGQEQKLAEFLENFSIGSKK